MTATNPFDRYGGWALVAGASAGLGAAFAFESARQGFDVVLLARRQSALDETASQIKELYGREVRCVVADMADPAIGDLVAGATADLDIGVFIYNAAATIEGRFLDQTLDDHRYNLAVNCWTPTVLTLELGTRMKARGRGAIGLVSSVAALQGIKYLTTYGAGKSYELILGEGLWDEFRGFGVDALAYVVGATASSTWKGASEDASYKSAANITTLEARILAPATTEFVARRLYEVFDQGPRQYSHPADEAAANDNATKPRAEVVTAMGVLTSGLARFANLKD